jgi:hypothetical protein
MSTPNPTVAGPPEPPEPPGTPAGATGGIPVATEQTLRILARLDTHINDEYQWIGQRLTWLLVSNSFLLLSFITAVVAGGLKEGTPIGPPKYRLIESIFVRGIPLIGLLSCACVFAGVWAAQRVVRGHKVKRDEFEEAADGMGIPSVGVKDGSLYNWCGKAAGYAMPVSLFILWFCLMRAITHGAILWR